MDEQHLIETFLANWKEYVKRPNETNSSILQRTLGAISVVTDLKIFNPDSQNAVQFYINLYELMNSSESMTLLIWSAVDVLQRACQNVAAKRVFLTTYNFIPVLSKSLETNLTTEKRLKALKLLRELSYGIKVSWQDAYLPHLLPILARWIIESKEEKVAANSLGILVNLIYNNSMASYTFLKLVDIKNLVHKLLKLPSFNTEMGLLVFKLFTVLERLISINIPEDILTNFVPNTFGYISRAIQTNDVHRLRDVVDFLKDMGQEEHRCSIFLNHNNYQKDIQSIINQFDEPDLECLTLVIEWLLLLIKLKIPQLAGSYAIIMKSVMTWVQIKEASSKALALARTLIVDSRRVDNYSEVIRELSLLYIIKVLDSEDDLNEEETHDRLAESLQVLQEIIKVPDMKLKIIKSLNENLIRQLLNSLLDQGCSPIAQKDFLNTGTSVYVHALALTAELASSNSNWLTFYSESLRNKPVQMLMAKALYRGNFEMKQKILQLTSSKGFPQECIGAIASYMQELSFFLLLRNDNREENKTQQLCNPSFNFDTRSLISYSQENKLDACINKFKSYVESNSIENIPVSTIMEMYEFKLLSFTQAQTAMKISLEAANNYSTNLQHRLAMFVSETEQLRKLVLDSQYNLEELKKKNMQDVKKLLELRDGNQREFDNLRQTITEKSEQNQRLNAVLVEAQKTVDGQKQEIESFLKDKEERRLENSKLLGQLQETKDSLSKKKQIIEETKEELASSVQSVYALKSENEQFAQLLHTYEKTIAEKEEGIQKLKKELNDFSRMRDMIFELTAKKKDDLDCT